jgi:hypothetical protein
MMIWNNGTRTEISVNATTVEVTDGSDRLANGSERRSLTADEAFELADEHDKLSHLLREAGIQARGGFREQG